MSIDLTHPVAETGTSVSAKHESIWNVDQVLAMIEKKGPSSSFTSGFDNNGSNVVGFNTSLLVSCLQRAGVDYIYINLRHILPGLQQQQKQLHVHNYV